MRTRRTLALGYVHACALQPTGTVYCWGNNGAGQLGSKTASIHSTPIAVPGLTNVEEVTAANQYSCVRQVGGTALCWGQNTFGELGSAVQPTSTRVSEPPGPVVGLVDAVEIVAGNSRGCARQAAGSVVCWGQTQALGRSSATGPVPVPNLTEAAQVASARVGVGLTCVRESSGGVRCFGALPGASDQQSPPVVVPGITDAIEVAVGEGFVCARRASGAVVCWGSNDHGQLGDGTTNAHDAPAEVVGLTDAVEITAGSTHACARRASGSVVCWGDNQYGAVGDGSSTQRRTPAAVKGLTDAIEIVAGSQLTCARTAAGAVLCWGDNAYGLSGGGESAVRMEPTAIPLP